MGSDLYMNPPAHPEYVVLRSHRHIAIYRWPGEMELADRVWTLQWEANNDVPMGMAFSIGTRVANALGHTPISVDNHFHFTPSLTREEMINIRFPKPKVYEGKHRGNSSKA